MTTALAAPSSASALWFLSRATGTMALLLLTVVLVLGILARGNLALPASPRFVTPALHRNLALLTVVMLAVHIVTAVADPYAPIRLIDAVLPFVSAYRPVWVGLGALAFDILIALIVTSLLRARIGPRVWRAVHWAAYASWPVAVAHGLGTGTDVTQGWLLALAVLSTLSVLAAVLWRILRIGTSTGRQKKTAATLAVAVPLALVAGVVAGPLAPHWAARAGTPATLLSGAPSSTPSSTPSSAPRGNGTFSGRTQISRVGALATVVFAGRLSGGPGGRLRITLRGRPNAGEGITLSDGAVSYSHRSATYTGPVTALNGGQVIATLAGSSGQVHLAVDLTVTGSQTFTGTVVMS